MPTIREGLGVTGYTPPSGFSAANRMGMSPLFDTFKVFRYYVDLQASGGNTIAEVDRSTFPYTITDPAFSPPLNASWYIDEFYTNMKAAGVSVIVCPQGAFANQILPSGTNRRKHPPIDQGDDPLDPNSYTAYGDLMEQYALRLGPTPSDPSRARVYVDPTSSFKSSVLYTGLDQVEYFQCGNEDNFPWHGGPVVMTAEMSAAKFYACYRAVRRSCPNAKLITGSILSANFEWYEDFMPAFDAYWDADNPGVPPPRDFYISWHRYHREGNVGQTQSSVADVGEAPEPVNSYALGLGFDNIVASEGLLGHMCTETGWSDSPLSGSIKQRAKIQEGYTLGQSAGLLIIRNHLIYASLPNYVLTNNYSHKDNGEPEPYTYVGQQYSGWHPDGNSPGGWSLGVPPTPKPQMVMVDQFLNQWGDWSVVAGSYAVTPAGSRDVYSVDVTDGSLTRTLKWTNELNVLDTAGDLVTPYPQAFDTGTVTSTRTLFTSASNV